jgi:signal transduction histidine kinase
VSLRAQLAELAERHDEVPVRLITAGPFLLPTGIATEIAAAVAELLTSVVKHAQAHQVWLTVLPDGGDITVTVRDDGVGFPSDQDTGGLGLSLSVKARVRRMAGCVRIRSVPGHGTEVELRIPKGNDHA